MKNNQREVTFGVIIGNRDFFPNKLVGECRIDLLTAFEKAKVKPIMLTESDTKPGGVETFQDAQKCAELFRRFADDIMGIVVVLPNFGDEKGVAETIKLSGLNVPVLIQAYPDHLNKMDVARRRDAWCGKISVCNNLHQYGIKFTLTTKHVVHPSDKTFTQDLSDFIATCRVVRGLRTVRIGAVGARRGAFNTVRYSEKILQRNGISVVTTDLSAILGHANPLTPQDQSVKDRIDAIRSYTPIGRTPDDRLLQIAKLDVALNSFMADHALDATAIQCWTSLQQNYGCNVCTSMSMMSENMLPSAVKLMLRVRSACMPCSLPQDLQARSWTGTTTTPTTKRRSNNNPGMFNYIAVMSIGLFSSFRGAPNTNYDKDKHVAQLKALVASKPKLHWIGIGKSDFLYESVTKLRALYDGVGVKYVYRESEGSHTWKEWRLYLTELAPQFFK